MMVASLVNSTFATPQHVITLKMHVQEGGRSRDLGPLCVKLWNALLYESRVKHIIFSYVTSAQWFGAGYMYMIATCMVFV